MQSFMVIQPLVAIILRNQCGGEGGGEGKIKLLDWGV